MRPLFYLLYLLVLLAAPAAGQTLDEGGRLASLSGGGSAVDVDIWGFVNPASGIEPGSSALGVHVSQAYGLAELRSGAIVTARTFDELTVSFGARTFGFELYRESSFRLRASRRLGRLAGGLRVGVALGYHHLGIDEFGSAGAVTVDAGWIASPLPGLMLGGSVVNLNGGSYTAHDDLPRVLKLGAAYSPGRITVIADVMKDVRYPLSLIMGAEFIPHDAFVVRAAAATEPERFTAGVGLRLGPMTIDLSTERHYLLGWSPAVGLEWGVR